MNEQELVEAIQKLERQKRELKLEQESLLEKWVEIVCPFKVGEIAQHYRSWSKLDSKKCLIKKVRWRVTIHGFGWEVSGLLLKANGEPGKMRARFTESDYYYHKDKEKRPPETSEIKLA